MDTPTSPSARPLLPRWLRVSVFVALIASVSGSLAYLVTWVDTASTPRFVSIRVDGDSVFAGTEPTDTKLNAIRQALDDLATQRPDRPVVVYLGGIGSFDNAGNLQLATSDGRLPLREVLEKLKACPAKQKLLVLDLEASAWSGDVYRDVAGAIPRELDAVADAGRFVLCSASPGQSAHVSPELGQSIFAHYFRAGLAGDADGYGDLRDGHISVKELAAFVQARVDRWAMHNRGDRQTPVLLGTSSDFTLASVDASVPRQPITLATPTRTIKPFEPEALANLLPNLKLAYLFAEHWQILEQQLVGARPPDAERIRKRFAEDMRGKLPIDDVEAIVFAHALGNARLDPAAIRVYDQILHPTPQSLPRTAQGLCIRQLADLAMRVEVLAWPREVVETMLRATDAAERAKSQTPYLPGYVELLEEPAMARHAGEIRLLTRGYSSLEDAKSRLIESRQKFERLILLNEKWHVYERLLDEASVELPCYLEALETMTELRTPWEQSATAARALADGLKGSPNDKLDWTVRVGRLSMQVEAAEKHAKCLQQHRQTLHAPFARDTVEKLDRQCRSPQADAQTLRHAEALLSVATPVLQKDDRVALRQSADLLSRQLLEETLALDKKDDAAKRLTPTNESTAFATVDEPRRSARLNRWRQLSQSLTDANPKTATEQHDHARLFLSQWLRGYKRYLARDFEGLNLQSDGIFSRAFYLSRHDEREAHVRMNVTAAVEPLTEKQPYANVVLEVTRRLPPGVFGPVELQIHRADDVWLDIEPVSASLPALAESKVSRTVTEKVALKVTRKAKAERTGLPQPTGFLVEARFEGRSYHHLVTVPIVPIAQELQILVSADPAEPGVPINEIRVRPGKVKQPHYVYVQNLTNRPQKVHVEISAGDKLVYKSQKLLRVEPDGVCKVTFDDAMPPTELPGPLAIRVLDQDRHTVLQERTLPVTVLSPRDYVQTAGATYEPGNKWAVQVQASRSVVGPAIAAQLVLPVQRIPGLMGVGGGTLHVELPTRLKSPRILFAEKLQMVNADQEEGPVYLHIDGVARAFVFSTTFTRTGEPNQPKPDDRPAVRLVAPQCVMSGVNCLVDVEVDNAPAGCKLEIALGRAFEDLTFKPEVIREFTDAKKRHIDLEASKDALVFTATIDDWTATFDTRAIVGSRALRARLIGADGNPLAATWQSILLDDSPPIARIAPTPAQVKKGTVLRVQAQGSDPESGVAQVHFFYGKPDKGEIPPAAPRVKAVPANLEASLWSAALQVPADHKGPLLVSVQVVNRAGMATTDTVTLEATDREPGKTGMGVIRGKVVEGPRPQPNLNVILTDERGKEIARTRTQADGSYVFEQIAPGRYRLVCVKPESQRRAIMGVIVEPDRAARIDLSLSL